MRVRSSSLMTGIGVIHSGLVLFLGHAQVSGMLRAGLVDTVPVSGGPYAAWFWSLCAGLAWIVLGLVFRSWEVATSRPVPAVAGTGVLFMGALGAVIAPRGGFWFLIAVGGLILWRARAGVPTTTATSVRRSSTPPGTR